MAAVLTLLAIIATTTGVGMLVPQVLRVRRLRTLYGVSHVWVGVGLAMNSWWLAYGLQGRIWGLVPISVLSLLLYGELARWMLRLSSTGAPASIAGGAAMLGWIPVVGLFLGGWDAAGVAIGLCYAAQFTPAAVTAWRAVDLDGISPATWVLALVEALAWLVYGALTADPALMVGGGGGSVMSALILVRLTPTLAAWRHRPPGPTTGPTGENHGGATVQNRLLDPTS